MPVTKIGAKWDDGDLVFYNKSDGSTIITIDEDKIKPENGVTGTFDDANANTIQVTDGIITDLDVND